MQNCFSSFAADSEIKVFVQLTNDSGTIITGTTADVQVFDLNDKVPSGLSTVEASTVPSRTFKVTAANAPGALAARAIRFLMSMENLKIRIRSVTEDLASSTEL